MLRSLDDKDLRLDWVQLDFEVVGLFLVHWVAVLLRVGVLRLGFRVLDEDLAVGLEDLDLEAVLDEH
jgi:hypothetical protein